MTSSSASATDIDPDLLPKLTTVLKWRAGPLEPEKTFYLVGTAHVSRKSCQDVETVIKLVTPQVGGLSSSLSRACTPSLTSIADLHYLLEAFSLPRQASIDNYRSMPRASRPGQAAKLVTYAIISTKPSPSDKPVCWN